MEAISAVAKRIQKDWNLLKTDPSSPEKAAALCMDELAHFQMEILKMYCLDAKCRLIYECEVSKG